MPGSPADLPALRQLLAQRFPTAARSAAHIIYLGVIVSVVMGVIGVIFAPDILGLLGAEPQVTVGTNPVVQTPTPGKRVWLSQPFTPGGGIAAADALWRHPVG